MSSDWQGKQITPVVKSKGVVVPAGAACPRTNCGNLGHLMSDHNELTSRQCGKCACVTQDVS